MKPFDLEKFLAGEPAVTRDGRKVIDFHYFKDAQADSQLVIRLNDNRVLSNYSTGNYHGMKSESPNDLFMEEKEVELWINVYKNGKHGHYYAIVVDSKMEGEMEVLDPNYISTHKITIKE